MANQPKTNDEALKELADLKLKFESLKIQYEKDITERKLAVQKLLESEEKFRTIIENSADAIFIVDRLGRYLFVNSKAIDLLGYSKEEILTMTITDIRPKDKVESHMLIFGRILQVSGAESIPPLN
jgi:PAS domain-containing protein